MLIDLRSDTVTKPTDEMRKIMAMAPVGDDVYGEDDSVNELEKMSAELFGKEAALFVPTGTMGNQLAILTHCQRQDEVLCEENSHVFYLECGAAAVMAGVQIRTLSAEKGLLTPELLEKHWRGTDLHYPTTRLVWIENTLNRAGGIVYPLSTLKEVQKWAKEKELMLHMDGARIFNASVASDISVAEIASTVDSVMFCISKGLGAPIGSVLVGTREFIESAKRWRKMMGGGMRQAGIVAAAGIYALNHQVERLVEDHNFAKEIALRLQQLGYELPAGIPETNILMVKAPSHYSNDKEFAQKLKENNILVNSFGNRIIRVVTHQDVSIDTLPRIVEVFKRLQEA